VLEAVLEVEPTTMVSLALVADLPAPPQITVEAAPAALAKPQLDLAELMWEAAASKVLLLFGTHNYGLYNIKLFYCYRHNDRGVY
jgi:hypothetical protein